MNTTTLTKTKWFWPWQDEKEEAWLGEMSQHGHHLKAVRPPCVYTFERGEPVDYTYRLDYMLADKKKLPEYLQIFQDAGWEYIGELSNWRYWRKRTAPGESAEIFTDRESKIKKYERLLGIMSLFLIILCFLGQNFLRDRPWAYAERWRLVSAIYMIWAILYALIIPTYAVVVVQLLRRIKQLKKKII